MRSLCLEIECLFGPGIMMPPVLIFVELVNIAANAAFVKQVEAARLLLTGNQLAECRQRTNPYLSGGLAGSIGNQRLMFAPDPCAQEAKDHAAALAGATTKDQPAAQLSQTSNAPTAQDLASAPAPQLATAYDPVGNTDPAIPESEFVVPSPGMQSLWSPSSIEEVMEKIWADMDWEELEEKMQIQVMEILDDLEENARRAKLWWCWGTPSPMPHKLKFQPRNQSWVGKWAP